MTNEVTNGFTNKRDDIDLIDFIVTLGLTCNYINKVIGVSPLPRARYARERSFLREPTQIGVHA